MIQGNLTKDEAYQKMKEGYKISHTYFTDDEYLYMENCMIFSEDGYSFDEWWETIGVEISESFEKPWRVI